MPINSTLPSALFLAGTFVQLTLLAEFMLLLVCGGDANEWFVDVNYNNNNNNHNTIQQQQEEICYQNTNHRFSFTSLFFFSFCLLFWCLFSSALMLCSCFAFAVEQLSTKTLYGQQQQQRRRRQQHHKKNNTKENENENEIETVFRVTITEEKSAYSPNPNGQQMRLNEHLEFS